MQRFESVLLGSIHVVQLNFPCHRERSYSCSKIAQHLYPSLTALVGFDVKQHKAHELLLQSFSVHVFDCNVVFIKSQESVIKDASKC